MSAAHDMRDELETTITRALSEAERASIAAAADAHARGAIPQVQVAPGVWRLTRAGDGPACTDPLELLDMVAERRRVPR